MTIGFPLDYQNDEFAFWIAFVFLNTQAALSAILMMFSVSVWYLMANCGWRYEALGHQIKKMGNEMSVVVYDLEDEREITDAEKDNKFAKDLLKAVTSHIHLME